MENEIEINRQLSTEDLFILFSAQLAKDFEGGGLPDLLPVNLPREFDPLRDLIAKVIFKNNGNLPGILYRVDINEAQIKRASAGSNVEFEIIVAELIIKRVLQKVIIRKSFSGK